MLIIGILVVIGVIGLVICKKIDRWVSDGQILVYGFGLTTSIIAFITTIALGFLMFITHNGYFKEQKKLEFDTRYSTIMNVVDNGCRYNTAEELVEMIAEYNSDVLKGRENMKNVWFKDFDYDFYEDLEVIEIGRKDVR